MSYTIIGDAVNTAARLMQMAKAGEVLLTGPVHEKIRESLAPSAAVPKGNVALRGKREPIQVYSVQLG